MPVLVIAEHADGVLREATFNTVTAATLLGGTVELLVAGADIGRAAEQGASIQGVSRVIVVDSPDLAYGLAENLAGQIVSMAMQYSHLLFCATTEGKNTAPRVAALLDVAQISDIIKVIDAHTFERPIYAGNILATVQSSDPIKVITVRSTAFAAAPSVAPTAAIELQPALPDTGKSYYMGQTTAGSDRVELTSAQIIVSGGRGLASKDNYQRVLAPLAEKMGAALGASRAAVDAGFAANDLQVGQTGKIVAPQLYIAVGISGAIQHLAGMKDSRIIVAINKDPDAPIFSVADYGLVADLFDAVPALVEGL